jgi:hypothetical protein
MDRIAEIRALNAAPPAQLRDLSEYALWSPGAPLFARAQRLAEPPHFYPVYRHEDVYSWSVLALIVRKGTLALNPRAVRAASTRGHRYFASVETIDRDILRVGGPLALAPAPDIAAPDQYAEEVAAALRADVAAVERASDAAPFVLTGGRDSLNLLLLPWKQRVTALSARPNFPLVERFVRANGLDIEVRELTDPEDASALDREVLENTCRADLQHYRWGASLRRIALEHGGRVIFWKGQLGDVVMTPFWKKYAVDTSGPRDFARKVYARTDFLLPRAIQGAIARRLLVPRLMRSLWLRGANWQGAHMTVIRGTSGALVMSAYHGARVQAVIARVDLVGAAQEDVRARIGARLLGRPVAYPTENPAPPPSVFRRGLASATRFVERIERAGIRVVR